MKAMFMCYDSKVRGERVQTSAWDVSPPAATTESLDLRHQTTIRRLSLCVRT